MQQKKGKRVKKNSSEPEPPSKKELLRRCKETTNVYEILELTHNTDNEIRLAATSQLCPCKVQEDIEEFWDRVFQLQDDEDPKIRARILHIICDGSPKRLELQVMDALEKFNRDPDSDIRRQAHKVLVQASKGNWNVL